MPTDPENRPVAARCPTGQAPSGGGDSGSVSTRVLWLPLLAFVIPTVVVAYGFVMPRHGLLDEPELTIGFASTVAGACGTYLSGVRLALRRNRRRKP